MCSTTIFTSILLMVFNFAIIFIIGVFMFKRFLQMLRIFLFLFDFCCLFVNCVIFFFSKIIIFIACSLKVHKNVSSLHTSIFFSIPSNVHITDTEYPQRRCSTTFIGDDFQDCFCTHLLR